jgi:pentatricopeptide repeat protein
MSIQAIELYRQMPSQFINESVYVSVLNACSHSGLVDQARSIFGNIQINTERIYTTMVYQTLFFFKLQQ